MLCNLLIFNSGWSMVQKQPISDFKWSNKIWSREEILSYNPDGKDGCFLEVDISIPDEHHDTLNCYPIIPEPLDISEKVASPMSLSIRAKRHGISDLTKLKFSSTKLAPNLLPKHKYICHIRNLQFYLQHGAVLRKVHRVLSFRQVKSILVQIFI